MSTHAGSRELPVKNPSEIRRLNVRQIQHVRSLIDTGRIVRRLQSFSMGDWELQRERSCDGIETYVDRPIEMTANQVRAAIAILDRVMPVLQSVQLEVNSEEFKELSTQELKERFRQIVTTSGVIDVPTTIVGPSVADLLSCNECDELKNLLEW